MSNEPRAPNVPKPSDGYYRRLVEGADAFAIISLNEAGRIIGWNRGAEHLMGWSREEALGRSGVLFFTKEDREAGRPEKELAEARRTGHANDTRWHVKKSGEHFWASASLEAVRDEGGHLLGYSKILRDLTAIKRAEEKVTERTADARRLAAELTLAEQRARHRVALLLYEEILQGLVGTQITLSLVRRSLESAGDAEQTAVRLETAHRQVDDIVATVRRQSVELSPPVLEGEGLRQALSWLGQHMREDTGLQVLVEERGTLTVPSTGMRVLLFQIVRELLLGAAAQAKAEHVMVTLAEAARELVVTVEGANDEATIEKIFGETAERDLQHARYRLGLFDGRLEVAPTKNNAARVQITVPIANLRYSP